MQTQSEDHVVDPLPGDLAIWVLIYAELLVFGLFFCAYAATRATHLELFQHSQATLDVHSGAINTALLISASYFVVRSIQALRLDESKHSARWMLLAIVCGCGFLVLKTIEFEHKFAQGVSLSSNLFYMFYLSMAIFHYMHVAVGVVILIVLWRGIVRGIYHSASLHGVESGAAYWHMVDLVWLVLFPLVYVL